jgi:hypothetical protein
MRALEITFLWVKFTLFGPSEEKISALNLNLRVKEH